MVEVEAPVRVRQPIFHERALWSVGDIARYISMSPSRVRDTVVCQADFPRAIRITPTSHPRWRAGEVWAWFEARQEA